VASDVIGELRKSKSEAKRSMRTAVAEATVADTPDRLLLLGLVEADVRAAGHVEQLSTSESNTFAVTATLAD
jgi:valyl-tRNA synthetase